MHGFLWRLGKLFHGFLSFIASIMTIAGITDVSGYFICWWNLGRGWLESMFGEWGLFVAGFTLLLVLQLPNIYMLVKRRLLSPQLKFVGATASRKIFRPISGDEPQEGPIAYALCFQNAAKSLSRWYTITGVSASLTYYDNAWQKFFGPLTGAWVNSINGTETYLDAGPVNLESNSQRKLALLLARPGEEKSFALVMESCPHYEWRHPFLILPEGEFRVRIAFAGKHVKRKLYFVIHRRGEELGGIEVPMPRLVFLLYYLPRFLRRLFL